MDGMGFMEILMGAQVPGSVFFGFFILKNPDWVGK